MCISYTGYRTETTQTIVKYMYGYIALGKFSPGRFETRQIRKCRGDCIANLIKLTFQFLTHLEEKLRIKLNVLTKKRVQVQNPPGSFICR